MISLCIFHRCSMVMVILVCIWSWTICTQVFDFYLHNWWKQAKLPLVRAAAFVVCLIVLVFFVSLIGALVWISPCLLFLLLRLLSASDYPGSTNSREGLCSGYGSLIICNERENFASNSEVRLKALSSDVQFHFSNKSCASRLGWFGCILRMSQNACFVRSCQRRALVGG